MIRTKPMPTIDGITDPGAAAARLKDQLHLARFRKETWHLIAGAWLLGIVTGFLLWGAGA